jgi:hypothetical protein
VPKVSTLEIRGVNPAWDIWITKTGSVSSSAPIEIRNEIFIYRCSILNPNAILPENPFVNSTTGIKILCKICNQYSVRQPRHILSGHSCATCRDISARKTLDSFKKDLYDIHSNSITCISTKYSNNSSKVTLSCNYCDKTWETMPRTVLSGHGCPHCAGVAQDKLYLAIEKESGLYKLGITKNPRIRMYEIGSVTLLMYWQVGENLVRQEEAKLQKELKQFRTTSAVAKCGYTEFFAFTDVELQLVKAYMNSKYNFKLVAKS